MASRLAASALRAADWRQLSGYIFIYTCGQTSASRNPQSKNVVAVESAVFHHPWIELKFSTVLTLATQVAPARSKTLGWYVVD